MTERDPLLRRLERSAVVFCLVAAGVAVIARTGRLDAAVGVLAGGMLIGVSYWAIKSGLDGFLRAIEEAGGSVEERANGAALPKPTDGTRRIHSGKLVFALAKFAGRYALLALIAYVMIARLRLHPIGLIVGASSIVAAAGIEAARNFAARA